MEKAIAFGLVGCLGLWIGCGGDSSTTPQPAASQGSEATPEPAQQLPPPEPAASTQPPEPAAPPPPIPAPDTALTDAQVIGIVQTINAGEIEEAQLAESKAKDARVKKFASQMISQHKDGQQKAGQFGKADTDNSVSNDLKVATNADLDLMKKAKPADFDAMYMTSQVKQHQAALDMITNRLVPATSDAKIKAFLETTRAMVEMHLKSANDIQQALLSSNAGK